MYVILRIEQIRKTRSNKTTMSLPYYGLLTGRLEKHGPQHGGNPHYLLYVQAGGVLYRVAVNAETTSPAGDNPPELAWYMVPDLTKSGAKAATFVRSIKIEMLLF